MLCGAVDGVNDADVVGVDGIKSEKETFDGVLIVVKLCGYVHHRLVTTTQVNKSQGNSLWIQGLRPVCQADDTMRCYKLNKFARFIQKYDLYYQFQLYSNFYFSAPNNLLSLRTVYTNDYQCRFYVTCMSPKY